ncbi:MAG: inositol monophosphatase family protein [Ferrimicrobium sp.]
MDHPLLASAIAAVEAAERELHKHTNTVLTTKTTRSDVVTAADRALEAIIRSTIATFRPGDSFLGEEDGALGPEDSNTRWIIDPIDGTVNFTYGIPAYAISIAAEVGDIVEVGVILDLGRHERFIAVRNQGATMNEQPIAPSMVSELRDALVGVGFAYDADTRRTQATILSSLAGSIRDVRQSGSASIDLCWTACGRLDGYFETGLKPWDHAAGALIVEEAGGMVATDRPGIGKDQLTVAAGRNLFPLLDAAVVEATRDASTTAQRSAPKHATK